jgi:AcrR family transcriptional regulator
MAEDPRVVRSRAVVIDATLALVAELGIGETTVDAIAERSGVAKTTIYRHWTGKPAIVLDALSSVMAPPVDPDTGSVREDLVTLVGAFAEGLARGPLAPLLTSMMEAAERDPEVARLHRAEAAARHQVLRDAVVRGVGRGELPRGTDADEVVAAVVGPVVYRRLIAHEPVEATTVADLVDRALRGWWTR